MRSLESTHTTNGETKKLLIANPLQFGYHTDTYHYCRYLRQSYDITYICWDYGLERIEEENVRVDYIPREGCKVQRLWRYIAAVLREMKTSRHDLALVVYFRMCSLLKCLERRHSMLLDIRTGYIGVKGSRFQRKMNNWLLYIETLFFKNITIISEGLRRDLGIAREKCRILPLGAERQAFGAKKFDAMRLLYVGTFNCRYIERTVEGFERFYKQMKDDISMSYDIVGYGFPEEELAITDAIQRSECKHLVKFHGLIPHKELGPILAKNNIGVAFVPMEDQFQCQPTTKIFEYHLSGMPVLATATNENAGVVNRENGVLIRDDSAGFFEGLKMIYQNLSRYDSNYIRNHSAKCTWERIINSNLAPYLSSLIQSSRGSNGGSPTAHKGILSDETL